MLQNTSRMFLNKRSVKRAKQTFCLQEETKDCGSACLASILRFNDAKFTLSELNELNGTNSNGTTVLGLYTACQELGLNAEALRANGIGNLLEINLPAILHVVIDQRLYHFIVYYGMLSDGKHLIGNPAKGVYSITESDLNEIWQSGILLSIIVPSTFCPRNVGYERKVEIFKDILKTQQKGISISVFLGLIIAGLSLSTALFYQYFIDRIVPLKDFENLILAFFALTLLLLANTALSYLREIVIHRQSKGFNIKVFSDFFENLINLPKSFFERRKLGDLTSRLLDIKQIDLFVSQAVGNAIINILLIFIFIFVIFTKSPGSALVLTITIPLTFFITDYFIAEIVPLQKHTLSNYGSTESIFFEIAKGIETIKAYTKERTFFTIISNAYNQYQNTSFSLNKTESTFNFSINLIMVLSSMSVLFLTSTQVLSGSLKLGEMLAVVFLSSTVINSATGFIPILMLYKKVDVSINRIIDHMILPTDLEEPDGREFTQVERVETINLAFGFRGYDKIIKKVDFEAKKGEVVLIKGDIGSGKSLLFSLLLRLYKADGTINIVDILGNRHNSCDIPKPQWRNIFGIVPQEVVVFNGSVLENIIMDIGGEQQTKRAKQIFDIVFQISSVNLPGGALTLIGQGGIKLSGGQTKLLGLARALFKNPQVLLLDEITAGMDSDTEKYTLELIDSLRSDFITIIISHQTLTKFGFDKSYNLIEGKLVQN